MFLIRQAGPADFDQVYPLAKILDSYNLPADRSYIRRLLNISEASFQGRLPKKRAKYLFVLEEGGGGSSGGARIVGCSLIIAKHGIPGNPHLWFALDTVTKRSRTLGIERSHQVLRLGYTEDGPTEVGGLIVLPRFRKHSQMCGLQISFVRFLYMAIHPERFGSEVIVEYRGAMGAGSKSLFWEKVGRVFTGMPYQRADRLSVTNKEFIWNLMPREPIYCALLPQSVQRAIGAIHPAAQRAANLLKSIGFKPLPQIEPFDGGPYYSARREAIRLARQMRSVRLTKARRLGGRFYLVGTEAGATFRAVLARCTLANGLLYVENNGWRELSVRAGEKGYACPLSG